MSFTRLLITNLDPNSNNSGYYELTAVLTHKGRSSSSGHYVAWVRHKGGEQIFVFRHCFCLGLSLKFWNTTIVIGNVFISVRPPPLFKLGNQ